MRPTTNEARLERLAEIIADGNDLKRSEMSVSEARDRQATAIREVMEASSGGEAKSVSLPSERG